MTVEKIWCIYSHLTDKEKTTVDKIVSTCLERNGFAPEDNWWEMNYLLPSEDLNDSQFFYLFLELHTTFHKTYLTRPQR